MLGAAIPAGVRAQEPEGQAKTASADDIFSGTVTQLTDRSFTVMRKVAGKPLVTREFVRDSGITVEGKLRNRARVTVRYKSGEENEFIAVHVIVR